MAPFPYPSSAMPPVKQMGSLSLRDGNDAAVSDPFAAVGRTVKPSRVPLTGESQGGGVIGMGFGGKGFVGSGLLEGGAPLIKRGTSSRAVSFRGPTSFRIYADAFWILATYTDIAPATAKPSRRPLRQTISFNTDYNRQRHNKQQHPPAALWIRYTRSTRLGRAFIPFGSCLWTTSSRPGREATSSEELDGSRAESTSGAVQGEDGERRETTDKG